MQVDVTDQGLWAVIGIGAVTGAVVGLVCGLMHISAILTLEWPLCRTNRTYAVAAIADAAIPRSCRKFCAALPLASWKQPFKAASSVDFKPTFRRIMREVQLFEF